MRTTPPWSTLCCCKAAMCRHATLMSTLLKHDPHEHTTKIWPSWAPILKHYPVSLGSLWPHQALVSSLALEAGPPWHPHRPTGPARPLGTGRSMGPLQGQEKSSATCPAHTAQRCCTLRLGRVHQQHSSVQHTCIMHFYSFFKHFPLSVFHILYLSWAYYMYLPLKQYALKLFISPAQLNHTDVKHYINCYQTRLVLYASWEPCVVLCHFQCNRNYSNQKRVQ